MKRTRLKRTRGFDRSAQQLASQFKFAVLLRDQMRCQSGSGYCDGPLDAHHILEKRQLLRHGHDDKLWDTRNGIALCRRHHDAHHRGKRIPLELLPPEAVEFAEELELGWLLKRTYRNGEGA